MSQHYPEARRCPICGKPRVERFKPFCSKRCADIDLSHWLKGDYAIRSRDAIDDDESPSRSDNEGATNADGEE